ncbi:MAG: hypothetical protein Q9209_000976 [Squamulea sp. 1 TL-2023]
MEDQGCVIANISSSPSTVKGETAPAPLPPSVEAAYKKKCIQLKKRLNEIEADNAAKRLRMDRNKRFIEKMRLEQAIMLEHLGKVQQKKGLTPEGLPVYDFDVDDPDSEGSSEGPPTQAQPNEKPLRSKRSHRRPMPSPPSDPNPNPLQDPQPYHSTPMDEYERTTFANYETDFNPLPYQPPKISYHPHLPGTFHDHNPNPLSEFHTWIAHCIHTNPADFVELTDEEKTQQALWAWQRLVGEKELMKMKAEYDERVKDWYARRAEWEMAVVREMERSGGGAGVEGLNGSRFRGGAEGSRGGEGGDEGEGQDMKVEGEGEMDEDMVGGRGGFTAVNG